MLSADTISEVLDEPIAIVGIGRFIRKHHILRE